MKLISFTTDDGPELGLVNDDRVIAFSQLAPDLPRSMRTLAADANALARLKEVAEDADQSVAVALSDVALLPVVPDPGKIICVGLNYADHAAEGGHDIPEYPALFMRGANSLAAHNAPLIRPQCSDKFDYEAELMIIVGRGGRHIKEEDALDTVFAYTAFNDGSLRDYQRKSGQWTAGKNFDQTGGLGPWAVTADALPAGASGLAIESRLNGTQMQSSNTAQLIFSVARIIAIVSEFSTLEPGDLIATGTPGGVGYPRNPPVFMKKGDVIDITIEGIGTLSNTINDE